MTRAIIMGRQGRILGLGRLIAEVQNMKAFADVATSESEVAPCAWQQLREIANALTTPVIEQPKQLFSSSAYRRINEHPNDDWRGQGNRKKRIKRNDR